MEYELTFEDKEIVCFMFTIVGKICFLSCSLKNVFYTYSQNKCNFCKHEQKGRQLQNVISKFGRV